MKKALALALSMVLLLMIAACGNGDTASTDDQPPAEDTTSPSPSPSPPPDVPIEDLPGGDIGEDEERGFKALQDMNAEDWENLRNEERYLHIELLPGTFTDELWELLLDGFRADHPNWTVDVTLDTASAENLQARILTGNPPAFFQGSVNFSDAQGHEAGVLVSNEWVMNAPAYDVPGKTLRETLLPGFDKQGGYEGIYYAVPFRVGGNGIWYNTQMFEDNGWEEPVTFAEFMDLCAEIRAAGITPLIYTGTFAPYPFNMFVYPRIAALGNGLQSYVDMTNLVDGAWSGPNVRQAIQDLLDMREAGVFTDDVLGTDYLLAQQMFFDGDAAMVFSGTWLEAEMMDVIPEGFRFNFMIPPVADTPGASNFYAGWAGGLAFTKGSGMEVEAMQFARYVLSSKFMKLYAERMGEPLISQIYADVDPAQFSHAAMSIYQAVNSPNTYLITTTMMAWYPELYNNFVNGIIGVLAGNETIDNLLTNTEAAVQAIKADDLIPKYIYG